MLQKVKIWSNTRLVPAWRVWWKLWSMRIGGVFAALMAFITAQPDQVANAINNLPPWLRTLIPVGIGPTILAVLFFVRFWNQNKVPSNQEIRETHGAE